MHEMIAEFQCPGCLYGPSGSCPKYRPNEYGCANHRPATLISGIGTVALGLPKGFMRLGRQQQLEHDTIVRLWDGALPDWDRCNLPVWAMELDGHLFVRTYMPRINASQIDVIRGKTIADIPREFAVQDVGTFVDEID